MSPIKRWCILVLAANFFLQTHSSTGRLVLAMRYFNCVLSEFLKPSLLLIKCNSFNSFKFYFLFGRDMMENFNPTAWNQNGPALLTRVLENQVCHTSLAEMTPEKCRGFKVFPPEEFYAVNWDNWQYFINPRFTGTVLKKTARSSVIHLW